MNTNLLWFTNIANMNTNKNIRTDIRKYEYKYRYLSPTKPKTDVYVQTSCEYIEFLLT